jgi:hypothetical protein
MALNIGLDEPFYMMKCWKEYDRKQAKLRVPNTVKVTGLLFEFLKGVTLTFLLK